MPANQTGGGAGAEEMRRAIAAFVASARQPALLEPGEEGCPSARRTSFWKRVRAV